MKINHYIKHRAWYQIGTPEQFTQYICVLHNEEKESHDSLGPKPEFRPKCNSQVQDVKILFNSGIPVKKT